MKSSMSLQLLVANRVEIDHRSSCMNIMSQELSVVSVTWGVLFLFRGHSWQCSEFISGVWETIWGSRSAVCNAKCLTISLQSLQSHVVRFFHSPCPRVIFSLILCTTAPENYFRPLSTSLTVILFNVLNFLFSDAPDSTLENKMSPHIQKSMLSSLFPKHYCSLTEKQKQKQKILLKWMIVWVGV